MNLLDLNCFAKDFSLSIKAIDKEHFFYALNQIDPYTDSLMKFELFKSFFEGLRVKGIEPFKYKNEISQKIIENVKNSESFDSFNKMDISKYKNNTNKIIENYGLIREKKFQDKNDGEEFVSFDLVTANVQSLNFIDKSILKAENFKELVKKYTNEEYLWANKKFRQIIFGELNPKRQQMIQRHIMSIFINHIMENAYLDNESEVEITSDEIIVKKKNLRLSPSEIIDKSPEEIIDINFRVEEFKIEKIHKATPYYLCIFKDKKKISNTPAKHMLEVVKYLESKDDYPENIVEKDKYFLDNGRSSMFLDNLFESKDSN